LYNGVHTIDRRDNNREAMTMIETREELQAWLANNRENLDVYEDGDNKGVFEINKGPALSFRVLGTTWEEVADALGANEV
jgi:hypothetical protein